MVGGWRIEASFTDSMHCKHGGLVGVMEFDWLLEYISLPFAKVLAAGA